MAGQESGQFTPENAIPQELEKKFLVSEFPQYIIPESSTHIRQGYITIESESEVRVRSEDNLHFTLTVKRGSGVSRDEVNVKISEEEFNALWPMSEGRRIEKTRYKISRDTYVLELDRYHGELEGFMTCEVEFRNEAEMDAFQAPEWVGREVTTDESFKNKNLAIKASRAIKAVKDPEMNQVDGVKDFLRRISEISSKKDGPVIVMVSGRTSSGKTTAVTSKILEEYGDEAIVISTDNYSKGNSFIAQKRSEGIDMNWDHPDYIDTKLLREHIEKLREAKSIDIPEYSFITGEREGTKKVDPAKIIIIEGLYALHEDIEYLGDVKAFVDISLHGSVIRRLLRDVHRTTMSPTEILDYYIHTVDPMYTQHVAPTKDNADFILVNEYSPDVESARSGRNELQIKFKKDLSDQDMKNAGAQLVGVLEQEDRYYHPYGKNLDETDEIVRIRKEGGVCFLTYKGPRESSDQARRRPVLFFEIPELLERTFAEMYGESVKTIKKRRRLYLIDGALVALDQTKLEERGSERDLGMFVEIQIPDEDSRNLKKLADITARLGLDSNARDTRPYVLM